MTYLSMSVMQTLANWDTHILLSLNSLHTPFWDSFMYFYSGRVIWIPLYLSLVVLLFRSYYYKIALLCIVTCLVLVCINDQLTSTFIRTSVARLRPSNLANPISPLVHVVNEYRGGRYGFPSAHASNCWGVAFFLMYCLRRRAVSLTIGFWALLTIYSRMYLGVHYFGDVLVGTTIGLVNASAFYFALCWWKPDAMAQLRTLPDNTRRRLTWLPPAVYSATVAVLLVVSLISLYAC